MSAVVKQAISIHAAREGGDQTLGFGSRDRKTISIHAAREGGDLTAQAVPAVSAISIHAAREGGDGFCAADV